jgi:hypothetical protein
MLINTFSNMKRISPFLLLVLLFCSCSRTDEKIIDKIQRECNITFDHQKNGVGAEVYNDLAESSKTLYSCSDKIKNIIDKTLDILPDKKEELVYNDAEQAVWSYYHWETPNISIELSIIFKDRGSIQIYIVNK